MNSVEYKYLIVTLEYPTFISMRFFDKVFFNGCGTTAAAMLNFSLVPSLSNFFTLAQSRPQALTNAAPLSLLGGARTFHVLPRTEIIIFLQGDKATNLFVVSG